MLRRRHKKSRAGCIECKTRHLKCDENHPECVNCLTARMKCSFASRARPQMGPEGATQRNITPPENKSTNSTPSSNTSSLPTFVQTGQYVNAMHIELFFCAVEGGEWAFSYNPTKETRPRTLNYVFGHPFLLYEFLAVSALCLSTQRPAQQSLYRDESTRLQSHALRMFNETVRDVNTQNIIPSFLFSGLLGLATLFETFHDPTLEANDWAFFEKVLQSIRLLQGVRTFIDGWWEFLLKSEIKHVLDDGVSPDLDWSDHAVRQFEDFRYGISKLPGLDDNEIAVYDEAVETLIWTYKSAFADESEPLHDQAIGKHAVRWFIAISPVFAELIVQKKPVALVTLGYVAVMLHKFRACWTVGHAGEKLLSVVEAHLEEPWRKSLSWPKMAIRGV